MDKGNLKRFKALLVGINAYPSSPLRGCLNDVHRMKKLLVDKFGAAPGDVTLLTDKHATTAAIKAALVKLAEGTEGDEDTVRLFHYSGHGSYTVDTSGDEADGRDEGICPYDYDDAGLLTDDTLRGLYRGFGKRCHLVLVMDSCHSGTVQRDPERDVVFRFIWPPADVRRRCRELAAARKAERDEAVKAAARDALAAHPGAPTPEALDAAVEAAMRRYDRKHYGLETVRGPVVLVAGCRDNQTSADAKFDEGYYGALTYHFTRALEARPGGSYQELVAAASDAMDADGFGQEPQLECSRAARAFTFLKH
ncbi:MAG: caspase family protein [Polyangiales bacterium]